MPDFGIFRGFNEKLFGDKLYAGQLPTQLGLIGSESFGFTGLLDVYPNAAAAYSLRKLRIAYTGSAIRVRRASDNTEQDIGFVDNELDTSTLTSFCSGTDGFVKTWYDQSGNGYDATQTTAANQPQIVSSGSVILENNKPTIKYDGVDDQLVTITFTIIPQPVSVFTLAKTNTSNNFIFNTLDPRMSYLSFRNEYRLLAGASFATGILNDGSNNLIFSLFSGVNSAIGLNSSALVVGNSGTTSLSQIQLGTISGTYHEAIVYPSDQSTNRTGIETNINNFYSIY